MSIPHGSQGQQVDEPRDSRLGGVGCEAVGRERRLDEERAHARGRLDLNGALAVIEKPEAVVIRPGMLHPELLPFHLWESGSHAANDLVDIAHGRSFLLLGLWTEREGREPPRDPSHAASVGSPLKTAPAATRV